MQYLFRRVSTKGPPALAGGIGPIIEPYGSNMIEELPGWLASPCAPVFRCNRSTILLRTS
jgi:hypothetical protein